MPRTETHLPTPPHCDTCDLLMNRIRAAYHLGKLDTGRRWYLCDDCMQRYAGCSSVPLVLADRIKKDVHRENGTQKIREVSNG